MKPGIFSPPFLACSLTVLVLASLALGPFMHETDQGWLLDGAAGIANGHLDVARGDFNFDKQFVSYLLPGVLFRFFPRPFNPDLLVLAGNVLAMVLFWGAFLGLLARSARRVPLALALPVILTPAFLVHSPFYASAFVSAALVMLLAAVLDRKRWDWPRHAVVFAMAFCAVGARLDAILLLPLLAMLHAPRRRMADVLKSPNTWLMAAAGLAAFFLGRALYLAPSFDFVPQPFALKQVFAYLAFGLGGAGLLLLAALHAVWRARHWNRCRVWLVFLAAGLAMPMGYYCLQLLSPRHCVIGALSVLVFLCASSGGAILRVYFRQKVFGPALKFALMLAALAPVFVGLDIPELRHPRLTFTQPTLVPSAAGVCPLGAYLGHALNVRRQHGFMDQNQAIWAAAKTTQFESDAGGGVPTLLTPVESYLILAIRLQDLTPRHHSLQIGQLPPRFYMDSRSLMRFQFALSSKTGVMDDFFRTTALQPATTTDWQGVTILRGDTNSRPAADSLSARLWVLNEAFGGNEFRIEPPETLQKIPDALAGKKLVLASRQNFTVASGQKASFTEINDGALGDWRVCEIGPLNAAESIRLRGVAPAAMVVAVSVFPEWMSLQQFQGHRQPQPTGRPPITSR